MSTKKSIPFEFFAPNQYIYYDINRLADLERETGAPIIQTIGKFEDFECGLALIVTTCRIGLAHHYLNKPGVMEEVFEDYIDNGGAIFEPNFIMSIYRALIATGILGKKFADMAVKNKLNKDEETEVKDEKNVKKPGKK